MKNIKELNLKFTWSNNKITEATLRFEPSNATQDISLDSQFENMWLDNSISIPENLDLSQMNPFQKKVLMTLRETKPGDTLSYAELALKAGYPKAARAVGRALATNPFILLFPCHRVIRKDGSLGNFSAGKTKEEGLKIKKILLEFEKNKLR